MPAKAPIREKTAQKAIESDERVNPQITCVLVVFALTLLQAFWFSRDMRLPSMDEANHLLMGLQYTNLLHHFHPWKISWLHKFLSINPFYPPAVYIYDGALKLAFGASRAVDTLCFISYFAALLGAAFGITYKIARSSFAASFAALLLFCYPQIQQLSHVYLLDLPLVATITVALLALMWWHDDPNWKRTLIAGVAVTIACFTKQLGAFYLFPPCLYLLVTSKGPARLRLLTIAAMTAAVMIPWFLVNAAWIKSYAAENAAVMKGKQLPVWDVFVDYLVGLPYSMSFLLAGAFAFAAIPAKKYRGGELALLLLSSLGGLALTSLLTCTAPLDRYAAPVLVSTAVITACGVAAMKRTGIAAAALALLFGALQTASFSFGAPWNFGTFLREYRGAQVHSSIPHDDSGWRHKAVLEAINQRDPGAPVWLNILPSDGHFNPHTFELLAAETGSPLKPTTSRRWTIVGDTVEFTPESALWYQWYLLKTGAQGNPFKDQASNYAYNKLASYVTTSGRFEQIKSWVLPDQSTLFLWRQK